MGSLLDPAERERRLRLRQQQRRAEERRACLEFDLDTLFAEQQERILMGFAEQVVRSQDRRWMGLGWSGRDQLTEFEHRK